MNSLNYLFKPNKYYFKFQMNFIYTKQASPSINFSYMSNKVYRVWSCELTIYLDQFYQVIYFISK